MKIYYVILILLFAVSLEAQWSNDPNNNLRIGYGLDPHICSDSAGGCYITYDYDNLSYPRKLALERLDKYGYKPWGDKIQILGELPGQSEAEIIEDGQGGVLVSYEDRLENQPSWTARIRVQRVDSAGNFLWGQTGVKVTLDSINQGLQQLVTDGEGGCVITWINVPFTYYVNRIDGNGNRMWGDSGIMLGISAYNTHPRIIKAADGNYYVETGEFIYRIKQNGEVTLWESNLEWGLIVATPDGGGILHSSNMQGIYHYKLIAQRKDSLGNNLWQEPYVEIADSLDINTVLKIQYNDGYYYYGWTGKKNGIDQVAQFQALRQDGSKLYPNGSLTIGKPPSGSAAILPLETNKTALIYSDSPDSLLVQTYDTLGNKLWNEEGILISHSSIGSQSYTTDGNGGFIVVGTIEQFTIVAQQVSRYGNLGEIITSITEEYKNIFTTETTLFQNYPNPFNSTTTLIYKIDKEGRVIINLYNTLGEKVQTLYKGKQSRGVHQISITLNNLPSGVYFYTLETDDAVQVKKLTILK